MNVRVEIVTDRARFAALRDAWQQAWDQSGTHIFQSHDWISGWLTGMRDRNEIRIQIALVWDGESIVGILPCAIHRRRSGLRVLQWAAAPFNDYCDCVINPAYGITPTLRRLWEAMRQAGGFDLISLQQVRPDAQCRAFLDAMAEGNGPLHDASRQERCMRIDSNWSNGNAFFRSLNKKARNNHTRGKRILGELGGEVALQVLEPGQPAAEAPVAVIEEILRLKEAWLRQTDPASPLLGKDAAVLRAILHAVWKSGLAKIFLLTCGGKIAAASINFVYADRMQAYFTSYDAIYDRASPGTILIIDYAQWSFDRGLRHVDFMRGEEAFKFRMANAETVLNGFGGARTLVGQMAVFSHRWWSRRRQQQVRIVAPEPDAVPEAAG